MQLPSKRGGLAHALAALFAAVLVASCGVALATPQTALAMTTEKATAKPNEDGGSGGGREKFIDRQEKPTRAGLICPDVRGHMSLHSIEARKAEFVGFVPSGVAAVAAMQAKGFAYLKVG